LQTHEIGDGGTEGEEDKHENNTEHTHVSHTFVVMTCTCRIGTGNIEENVTNRALLLHKSLPESRQKRETIIDPFCKEYVKRKKMGACKKLPFRERTRNQRLLVVRRK
jgi:hypothetical protein